ncbi:MAG: hypothetical protein KH828_07895 [Clostridiales bacterium]|nr:hypothetical protein [Clostridiales bacterium]
MAGAKARNMEADYLNIGTKEEEKYVLMGFGFTKIDDAPSAQVKSRRYVNDKGASKSIGSYDWNAPYELELIEEEEAINFIAEIGRREKIGTEAEADYVKVDLAGTKGEKGYPARKRRVAIEVAEFTDSDGEITGSGNLLGKSDWKFGFFDVKAKTFTEETAAVAGN